MLTCADGNDYLAGLHWVSWSGGAAFGRGTEHVNDCIPNCAAGPLPRLPGAGHGVAGGVAAAVTPGSATSAG